MWVNLFQQESEPKAVIILSVDLHCIGCAKKIEKSLLRMKGVAGVKVDMVKNQVIIEGVVEPQAVCNMITEKTKTSAKILFPLPLPLPVPVVVSSSCNSHDVELNVNMHCEACAQQLRHKILKMKGVSKVETEVGCGKVRVMGTMDGEKLVEYVYRRTKKQAKIVPQPQPQPQPDQKELQAKQQVKKEDEIDKQEGGDEDAKLDNKEEADDDEKKENQGRMMYDYQPALYLIPPPQLFSDDNPNACSIS
ncbi:hypothetical protein OSB04_026074 [Centaurea solstitialis]|uniref:HMA domain-containing protein n=1 Tax=Centaurea solstitialis TaxID=347529 RepID=A0AA38SIQ0_9ASTR|nr:hypothetical protein OSB04_026074 [Centaurea solstitialis]